MHYRIARIDLWAAVKVAFVIFTVLALIMGFIWSVILFAVGGILQGMMPEGLESMGMMRFPAVFTLFLSVIIAPIYGVIATLGVAIAVFLYNVVAGWTGGLTVELRSEIENIQPTSRARVPVSPEIDYDTGN